MKPIVDYLIVIPLDEEFGYVRDVIEPLLANKIYSKTIGPELYALALLPTANGEASTVILSVGRMTEAPVQSAVETAVRTWRPAAVVMVGIAGSLEPERVKLGDVIVPSKVFGYTEAKVEAVNGHQRTTYRPTGERVDCELSAQARAVHLDRIGAWRASSRRAARADTKLKPRLLADEHDGSPKLHISNNDCIASGNTVVASKAFAQEIRNALGPTVSAVEMEAKGLCEALAKIKNAPPALVVRGISDLADEEKAALEKNFKDSWRRWAAQNAARFVLLLIKWRTKIAEGYRPVARPAYNMKHHIDSGRICLQARIKAREVGERNIAFSPFLVCEDGLPRTKLTLEGRRADDSPAAFADVLLRHADDQRILVRVTNEPHVTCELERTGKPPLLELLVGLPPDIATIELTATDEFGRTTRAGWPHYKIR